MLDCHSCLSVDKQDRWYANGSLPLLYLNINNSVNLLCFEDTFRKVKIISERKKEMAKNFYSYQYNAKVWLNNYFKHIFRKLINETK